jgi:hypothetical protein
MARWLVLVAAIVASGGCYSEPRPACGFVCGEGGSCPGGYTCNTADNRCHLDGTTAQCDSFLDAAPDTPDTTPPVVLMKTPDDLADDVSLNASVTVIFSEPVTGFGCDEGFKLEGIEGIFPCSATAELESTGFRVDYSSTIPFTGRAVLSASLNGLVMDNAGNPLAPITWMFRTQTDSVAPTVASTTPANGDTMVQTNAMITVQFSEPINFDQMTSITVDQGVTGNSTSTNPRTLAFTADTPGFAAATTYTVTVGTNVTDFSGNPLPAPFVFSFTTM